MTKSGGWFKVRVELIVRADDENTAINRAADAVRYGYESVKDVLPVGEFDAVPFRDHVTDALDASEPPHPPTRVD